MFKLFLDKRENARRCIYFDSEDCAINFDYEYTYDRKLLVRVKEEPECPQEVNTAIVVGSVALITALIGLLIILVIRLIVWYKDKKECEKFLAEVEKSKLSMVCLYSLCLSYLSCYLNYLEQY